MADGPKPRGRRMFSRLISFVLACACCLHASANTPSVIFILTDGSHADALGFHPDGLLGNKTEPSEISFRESQLYLSSTTKGVSIGYLLHAAQN